MGDCSKMITSLNHLIDYDSWMLNLTLYAMEMTIWTVLSQTNLHSKAVIIFSTACSDYQFKPSHVFTCELFYTQPFID